MPEATVSPTIERELSGARVLVTGLSGFTGGHLRRELERCGATVVGLADRDGGKRTDIGDRGAVRKAVTGNRFDAVIHLAGVAFVAHGDANEIYRSNIIGTRNLLEALCGCAHAPSIVIVASSASIYGSTSADPIKESEPPLPASDYAISKLAVEGLCRMYAASLPIVVVRPFNYTGIGQHARFVVPKLVEAFRRRSDEIELGNVRVWREFMDVRVVAEVYRRLLVHAPVGVTINIASGRYHSLEDVLKALKALTDHHPRIRTDLQLLRSNDVAKLCGSPELLERTIGEVAWPTLHETLEWMLQSP